MHRSLLPVGTAVFLSQIGALKSDPSVHWQPLCEPGSGGALTSLEVDPTDSKHLILGGDMLGTGVSRDEGQTWQATTGFDSWEMADSTFDPRDPKTVWIGTMSGPYVSKDGGNTWTSRRQGMPPIGDGYYASPILKVWIDPKDSNRLLAFGGSWRRWPDNGGDHMGTIWESKDGGQNWSEYSKVKKIRYTLSLAWTASSPDVFYAVVDEKGLYKSTDGARTWTPLKDGLPGGLNMVSVDPTDANHVWISTGPQGSANGFGPGGIFRSSNGGATWHACNNGLNQSSNSNFNLASGYGPLVVAPSDGKTLYTSDQSWASQGIYCSHDGGDSWTNIFDAARHAKFPTAYPAGMGASVLTVDPHAPMTLYAANTESVIETSDGGGTWSDLTSEKLPGDGLWHGRGFSGLCSINIKFNPFKADDCVVTAMDAGRYLHSEDGYKSWRFATTGFDWAWGGGNDVCFAGKDGQVEYGSFGQGGSGNLGKSTDGGRTWAMLGASPDSGLPPKGSGTDTAVYALPRDPDKVWTIYNGTFYASKDGGSHFQPNPALKNAAQIVADAANPTHFYVSTSDGLFETNDGQAFTPVSGAPAGIHGFALDPKSAGTVWATTDAGLVKLHDGKCDQVRAVNGAAAVALDPTNPNRIALTTSDNPYHDVSRSSGVWLSDDGGKTWTQNNDGLACTRGRTIAFNPFHPDEIVFGSFGRGYFVAPWPESK